MSDASFVTASLEIRGRVFVPYISRRAIRTRVAELAEELTADYHGRRPVFVCVLNGAFLFFADLVRGVTLPCDVDFVKLSSYGADMEPSPVVTLEKDLETDIAGRDVVVVEDIIDTGRSMDFLKKWMERRLPASIAIATLLHKPARTVVRHDLEYVGFVIPPRFVVGYGLDYAQEARALPEIYMQLDEDGGGAAGEESGDLHATR